MSATNTSSGGEPASTRRISAAAAVLRGHPDDPLRVLDRLDPVELANLAEVIAQLQRSRAIAGGDLDAIVDRGFEQGFGRDGLPLLPWVEGEVVVCPGGLVARSAAKTNHRCRFISVDDVWIWDSVHLIREDKRSSPGDDHGFRAVALVPAVSSLALDVVSGRARRGLHSVDHVVSYEVRRGDLVEVSQRQISQSGHR